MSSPETDRTPDEQLAPGSKLLIGILVIAAFVMILNETIMSVALPTLMVDLEITATTAQWLTTGFLLTMAVVIPVTGYLFQRFTLRQVFVTAMTLFTVGTLLAASAPGFELLLLGRITQASGTAIMLPLLMTTVLTVVPAHKRGAMMGVISIVIAVAPAVGPTISGVILDSLNWRWMFWLVLPIALVAFGIGTTLVKNVTETGRPSFDPTSVVLSALAFGGIVYGLSSLGHSAEESVVPVWLPLVVGVIALVVFVLRQIARQERGGALLDMRPFRTPTFSIGLGMIAISMMALFGALILLPMYLQNVRGLDTLNRPDAPARRIADGSARTLRRPHLRPNRAAPVGHSRSHGGERRVVVDDGAGCTVGTTAGRRYPHAALGGARAHHDSADDLLARIPSHPPVLARQRDLQHRAAAGRSRRNRVVRHRHVEHRSGPNLRRGNAGGWFRGRHPHRIPVRWGGVTGRGGCVVLHPSTGKQ